MKFPADPESRSAERERGNYQRLKYVEVVRGTLSTKGSWITLTTDRGGQIGHERIACPAVPQYKQRPWASLLCLFVNGSRVVANLHGFWSTLPLWLVVKSNLEFFITMSYSIGYLVGSLDESL